METAHHRFLRELVSLQGLTTMVTVQATMDNLYREAARGPDALHHRGAAGVLATRWKINSLLTDHVALDHNAVMKTLLIARAARVGVMREMDVHSVPSAVVQQMANLGARRVPRGTRRLGVAGHHLDPHRRRWRL